MTTIWKRLHEYFYTNDGSLPEITLKNLSATEIPVIYDYIRQNSTDITRDRSYYWDIENNCERSLSLAPNAAQLVIQGKAEAFHFVVARLEFLGTKIPDLGVRIARDEIDLDYRMGQEWGPSQVDALFEFFYQIYLLAPQVYFEPDYLKYGQHESNEFDLSFREYLATKK